MPLRPNGSIIAFIFGSRRISMLFNRNFIQMGDDKVMRVKLMLIASKAKRIFLEGYKKPNNGRANGPIEIAKNIIFLYSAKSSPMLRQANVRQVYKSIFLICGLYNVSRCC